MFFSTGVDGKKVLSLARKYIIYHDYQCAPALWEGFNILEREMTAYATYCKSLG